MTKKTNNLRIQATGGDRMIRVIEAAAPKSNDLAKVDGVAYSGGSFRQGWSDTEMVVDLAGMGIAAQLPLLLNHINWPDCRLGVVSATVTATHLAIAGGIDTGGEEGRNVVARGKNYQWQLSIGADVLEAVNVPAGESRTINGRSFTGPFLHVVKSQLREVSVVAVGADSETHLRIAASLNLTHANPLTNKGVPMNKKLREFILAKYSLGNVDDAAILAHLDSIRSSVETEESAMAIEAGTNEPALKPGAHAAPAPVIQAAAPAPAMTAAQVEAAATAAANKAVEAARKAETERIEAVKTAATDYPEIQQMAISAGWSKDHTVDVVNGVKAHAARLPGATGNIIVRSGPVIDAKAIEAALCLQVGIGEKTIIASCGQSAVETAAAHMRGMGLKDVMIEACRLEGKTVGIGFSHETIRAAFSTVSLPGILSSVANKRALQTFDAQESIAARLCSVGDLSDFKESERYRLTDIGDLEIVAADGEIKEGGLGEDKATNKLDTYGKTFTLTRQMIYNDDMGEFLKIPTAMGARAKRKIDQVFFIRLMKNPVQGDGKTLFSGDHKNFTGGVTGALGVDSLEKAITKFLEQVDGDNQPIAVSPKFLLVPTNLFALAQRLTMSAILFGGTEVAPASNVISNYNLTPVASPYLVNSKYPNFSDSGWYLFADPSQVDTFEIGYFQGRRNPTVEKGDTDFNTLGMAFRVYFDFGVREQDHRGMSFNKGKA